MQHVDMSEKVIHASHDMLLYILWFNEQILSKLPYNGDINGPEI